LLGEAAQVASRSEPDLKRFYERLAKRCGKAKATVALARKLLIRCCCGTTSTTGSFAVVASKFGWLV
jgi:hypothetical protein